MRDSYASYFQNFDHNILPTHFRGFILILLRELVVMLPVVYNSSEDDECYGSTLSFDGVSIRLCHFVHIRMRERAKGCSILERYIGFLYFVQTVTVCLFGAFIYYAYYIVAV